MDEEEEVPTCPLCLEELDATDRAVKACQCGYQVCLWCLHQIRERHNGKCPACRTPYEEQNFKISSELNHEAAAKEAKERANARKERQRLEKAKALERERERANAISQAKMKTNLKHARIVQRNLVYIIGLSLSLAREEVLRRADMFGKFGRIAKVLVNRAHPYNADAPGGPSIAAYVLYQRDQDASNAARQMDIAVYDGREIRCAIACTKYCDTFVRSGICDMGIQVHCGNPDCMYIHEILQSEDVLTREEVLARQLGPPPPAHLFGTVHRHISPVSAPSNPVITPVPQPLPSRTTSAPSTSASTSGRIGALQPSRTMNLPINIPNTSSGSISARPRPSNPIIPNGSTPRSVPSSLPSIRRPTATGNPSSIPVTINRRSSPPSSPDNRRRKIQNNTRSPQTQQKNVGTANPPVGGWNSHAHQHQSMRPLTSITRSPARSSPLAAEETNANRKTILSPARNMNSASVLPSSTQERSPPPGFERQQQTPARPPGFETKPVVKAEEKTESGKSRIPSGPPPGFGLPPFVQNNDAFQTSISAPSDLDKDVQNNPIHPSMTWSQEASADKVVTPHKLMRGRTLVPPIGTIGSASTGITPPPNALQNPPEFVDVLGRIGGSLGVTSEVNLKPSITPYSCGGSSSLQMGGPSSSNNLNNSKLFPNNANANSSSTGSRFGDLLSQANPLVNLNDPYTFSSSSLPFGDPNAFLNRNPVSAPAPEKIVPSKRSNSRFGFARESSANSPNSAHSSSASLGLSGQSWTQNIHSTHANSTSHLSAPGLASLGSQDVGIHLLHGDPVYSGSNNGNRISGQRNVNIGGIGNINNGFNTGNVNVNIQYQQQHQQQTQKTISRFDFAEGPLRHQPVNHMNMNQNPPLAQPSSSSSSIPGIPGTPFGYKPLNFNDVPRRQEPPPLSQLSHSLPPDGINAHGENNSGNLNMNIVNKFQQMTTADKLASLFNQASWAPGALPPMPQLNTEPKSESQLLAALTPDNNNRNNNNNSIMTPEEPASEPSGSPSPQPSPPPPGFSEATSEKKKKTLPVPDIDMNTAPNTPVVPVTLTQKDVLSAEVLIAPVSPDVASSSDNETAAHKRTRSRREKRDKKRKAAAATTTSASIPNGNGTDTGTGNEKIRVNIIVRDDESLSMSELTKEVQAARERETLLQTQLNELQRRIRSFGKT